METLVIVLVLLAATRLCGELAERCGQPMLVGELISGVLLGIFLARYGTTVPLLVHLPDSEAFVALSDLGMFFLMLLAGIEMQPRDFARGSGRASAVALGGVVVPLGLGYGLGWLALPESSLKLGQCLFLGTAMAVTAIPVTVRVLMDLGKLHTRVGRTLVSAALVDDILSLILLAVLTGIINDGAPSVGEVLLLLGNVGLFFVAAGAIGWFFFPWIGKYFKRFKGPETDFSMLVIAALAYAVLADLMGLHFIVGAFLAGVFFERRSVDKEIYDRVQQHVIGLTVGLLAPIFFASIGLRLDLTALKTVPVLLTAILVIAFLGKFLGAGLPAYWAGMSRHEAYMVGVGMSGRGAVELIIASVALEAGLFRGSDVAAGLFSAVVIMAVVTTVMTPVLMRRLVARAAIDDDAGDVD